ncbi:hypothetical protein PV04_03701 [Phialophora macrospora]|uniref:Metallo-beta-lactamase domain-containing protein n=1 Tax=Phialophora macrospora TaxID=1851006 RepID=A0A0D2EBA3_9EURO|nr:hypothetical protein PV04_03701 [Phialophora macrospora]
MADPGLGESHPRGINNLSHPWCRSTAGSIRTASYPAIIGTSHNHSRLSSLCKMVCSHLNLSFLSLLVASQFLAQTISAQLPDAATLLQQGIAALGGRDALSDISGLTYGTTGIYRSYTLMQNYDLNPPDTKIASSGSQTISFQFLSDGQIQQRIDRLYQLSPYYYFGDGQLLPRNITLTVRSGSDGYACLTRGNLLVAQPPDVVGGYVYAPLAEWFVLEAMKLSPLLLTQFNPDTTTAEFIDVNGISLPSVHDPDLDITIIFNAETSLPLFIRTIEDHALYGPSTRDLHVSNYTTVGGVLFPHRLTTLYNGWVIEDFDVSAVTINPNFASTFFDGLSANSSVLANAVPETDQDYTRAEVSEWAQNLIYSGFYTGSLGAINATQPIPALPNAHHIIFTDADLYKQWVLVFEDAIFVTDAPAHQSELLIRWVRTNFGRPVTHVLVTHHHHDHIYGISNFINQGAQLVVPEMTKDFWSTVPDARIITFNESSPFIHRDSKMQVRHVWHPDAPHAADLANVIITSSCPGPDDPIAVMEADVWNPGFPPLTLDMAEAKAWLDQIRRDGLSRNALITPCHGNIGPLTDMIAALDAQYPDLKTTDWTLGGPLCDH